MVRGRASRQGQLGAHVGLAPFALGLPGTAAALMFSPRRRLEQPFGSVAGWVLDNKLLSGTLSVRC
jgi:hypothetical protein